MTENVENLMLEHLKRFQATLDRMDRRLDELTIRQTETHAAVLSLQQDQLNDAEAGAHLAVRVDGIAQRLDRSNAGWS